MKGRAIGGAGDYRRSFASQDGANFRVQHQELGPAIRRTELIRAREAATGPGAGDRRYIGSIPQAVLIKWLEDRGFTYDQWARNEGGAPYDRKPEGTGVYDQFLKYFLSRDFSKLHTQHTTTRRGASSVVVPASLARQAVDLKGVIGNATDQLRGT